MTSQNKGSAHLPICGQNIRETRYRSRRNENLHDKVHYVCSWVWYSNSLNHSEWERITAKLTTGEQLLETFFFLSIKFSELSATILDIHIALTFQKGTIKFHCAIFISHISDINLYLFLLEIRVNWICNKERINSS